MFCDGLLAIKGSYIGADRWEWTKAAITSRAGLGEALGEELTVEEKQQIENQERQRVAKEQYRATIRAELERSPVPARRKNRLGILLGAACLIGAAIGLLTWERKVAPPPAPQSPVKAPPREIAEKYSGAVVVLETYDDRGQRVARSSGFISSPAGEVVTNYDVIRGGVRMQVQLHDQSTHDVQYIAGFDIPNDIAVLQIEGADLPSVHLGNSSSVKIGDHVTALGASLDLDGTLMDGIISAVRETGSTHVFQTTAPVFRGASGGPIFDDYGSVVALVGSGGASAGSLNIAIPIDPVKELLRAARHITFAELLSATVVHQPILTSSLSVPPQVIYLPVDVPPQGGVLTGSFSVYGGLGNDLGVSVVSANGTIWNGGVIRGSGDLNIPLGAGRYSVVFNNKMAAYWIASKTVSGSIELSYYR